MARILSPLIGRGKGQLGAMTLYHTPGYAGVRQRSVSIRNPQSYIQMKNRVFMSTIARAYGVLKPICDHSFQGQVSKTDNNARFCERNIAILTKLIAEAEYPNEVGNFNPKNLVNMLPNYLMVSEGSLPTIGANYGGEGAIPTMNFPRLAPADEISYNDVLTLYGLPKGSQLTFVFLLGDSTTHTVHAIRYARLILAPSNGDYDALVFDHNSDIEYPNPNNEGLDMLEFGKVDHDLFHFVYVSLKSDYMANYAGIGGFMIASYGTGKDALRSTEYLSYSQDMEDSWYSLNDAIQSYLTPTNSSLYLNQSDRRLVYPTT